MPPRLWREIGASLPIACVTALGLALASAAPGQVGKTRARATADPYTGGDKDAIAKAGYVSYGPFPLGSNHTTLTVEELLGTEPLIWIETEHFRLGCALPAVSLKSREEWGKPWKERVEDELDVLRERLPNIKKRVRGLDPWLRAHLYALRLETLYDEVLAVLGRDDDWFPKQEGNANDAENYRGLGPYFGMKEKFVVLLFQKGASHARYTGAFQGFEIEQPIRYHDIAFSSMYWGCSEETANGLYRIDLALHTNLVFNIAHNLYTCYRGFGHDLPPWLVTGLAHWHARKISPRFPTYDRKSVDEVNDRSNFWDWEARVAGLIKHDVFEPLDAFLQRDNAGTFGLEQHMQAWAFVDFLLAERRDATAQFVHLLKAPFHGRLRMPTAEELQRRQQEAFQAAFGATFAELDDEWRSRAAKRKRGRRRR